MFLTVPVRRRKARRSAPRRAAPPRSKPAAPRYRRSRSWRCRHARPWRIARARRDASARHRFRRATLRPRCFSLRPARSPCNSVTALSAASARSRAWLALAMASSVRRLRAVSAMPSAFMALSAAVARWVSASSDFEFDRVGRAGRGHGADRHQAGQPEPEQNKRHDHSAGNAGSERCHANRDAMRTFDASAGGGSGAACGGSCPGEGEASAGGGGTSVAVRSMVGAARLLRRAPGLASSCAFWGASGVVRFSAMPVLSELAHPFSGNNANGAEHANQAWAGSRSSINAASSGRFATRCCRRRRPESGSAIGCARQKCRTASACSVTPACGRAGEIIVGAALGKMQHGVDLAGLERRDQRGRKRRGGRAVDDRPSRPRCRAPRARRSDRRRGPRRPDRATAPPRRRAARRSAAPDRARRRPP